MRNILPTLCLTFCALGAGISAASGPEGEAPAADVRMERLGPVNYWEPLTARGEAFLLGHCPADELRFDRRGRVTAASIDAGRSARLEGVARKGGVNVEEYDPW